METRAGRKTASTYDVFQSLWQLVIYFNKNNLLVPLLRIFNRVTWEWSQSLIHSLLEANSYSPCPFLYIFSPVHLTPVHPSADVHVQPKISDGCKCNDWTSTKEPGCFEERLCEEIYCASARTHRCC